MKNNYITTTLQKQGEFFHSVKGLPAPITSVNIDIYKVPLLCYN